MRTFSRFVVVSTLAVSALAFAHDPNDEAVDYRMGIMNVVDWNFDPLGAMVKGKQPFDAAEFARRAARIAAVSDQLVEGFPKGSDSANHTAAKSDIWANWDDFQTKAKDFDTQAKLLADIAKGNDESKDKDQFKKLADTCKACHNKYKKKD